MGPEAFNLGPCVARNLLRNSNNSDALQLDMHQAVHRDNVVRVPCYLYRSDATGPSLKRGCSWAKYFEEGYNVAGKYSSLCNGLGSEQREQHEHKLFGLIGSRLPANGPLARTPERIEVKHISLSNRREFLTYPLTQTYNLRQIIQKWFFLYNVNESRMEILEKISLSQRVWGRKVPHKRSY